MNTKTKPIIVWDLHEVVFTRNFFHWIYLFVTYKRKWRVIRSLDWHITSVCFRYLLHVLHIKRAELSSQELVDYARAQNKTDLIDLIVRIGSDYHPIQQTVQIIEALHKQGYTQHVGSNIGATVYDHFKRLYQNIFAYFDVVHIVHYHNGSIVKKPNPLFFTNYMQSHNIPAESIIFIDDKKYNTDAAQQLGIDAIQFKTPEKLTKELVKRNILRFR